MKTLLKLTPGDEVDIVAPASGCEPEHLKSVKALLASWQLNANISDDIFGKDLLCANSDEKRLDLLKKALLNSSSKAVICLRGGYGSARLIPGLNQINEMVPPKLFVGMSDITALNLFFQQRWGWPIVHAGLAPTIFTPESILAIKSILFGEMPQIEFVGVPLNIYAQKERVIHSTLTGGNLCLLQMSIGTSWQLQASDKILFIEEVNERGYRIDRMFEQMRQANIFNKVQAIVFGDFTKGLEPDGSSLVQPVIERFAQSCDFPVIQIKGVGHDRTNFPIIFNTQTQLNLGPEIKLICST